MKRYNRDLSPLIKWTGGKDKELKHILPCTPDFAGRYIEPFVGGGAVFFTMQGEKIINDKSLELINLYNNIKNNNCEFVEKLQSLQDTWSALELFYNKDKDYLKELYIKFKLGLTLELLEQAIKSYLEENSNSLCNILPSELRSFLPMFKGELYRNITDKFIRMKKLELSKGDFPEGDIYINLESSFKGSFYMLIRNLHNQDKFSNSHYFYFVREYCYSSMFRYNSNGDFNVAYGGNSYNNKNFQKKIDYIKSERLKEHFNATQIFSLDFEDFLKEINPQENDFMFLDPPYDSKFSSYANNKFELNDQERLANYLINDCKCKFMLVVKNTEFISNLYNHEKFSIFDFDKKYQVSFMNRNKKEVKHLVITNYI